MEFVFDFLKLAVVFAAVGFGAVGLVSFVSGALKNFMGEGNLTVAAAYLVVVFVGLPLMVMVGAQMLAAAGF